MDHIPQGALKLYELLTSTGASGAWLTAFIAMLPIAELRGAIPVGLLLCKQSVASTYLIAVAGNMVPVPFLLYLFNPLSRKLSKVWFFKPFFDWLYRRTTKRADVVERYGAIGLILFVAIPLPVTGAWTGSFAASIFRIRFRYALPAILCGVMLAGIIVTFITLAGEWGVGVVQSGM